MHWPTASVTERVAESLCLCDLRSIRLYAKIAPRLVKNSYCAATIISTGWFLFIAPGGVFLIY